MYKRVVLKLSGEVLAGGGIRAYDDEIIGRIVREIGEVLDAGTEISLVVGGGNFWRGRNTQDGMDRVKSDQIGMLATVMNAIYLTDMFRLNGISSIIMTPFPVGPFTTVFSRELAAEHLARGSVVINAAGTGHPYLSTDTIAALRAAETGAGCILYAKNIDGVYDKNPCIHKYARRYRTLSYKKVLQDKLEAADIAAMNIACEANIDSLLFQMEQPGNIAKACGVSQRSGGAAGSTDGTGLIGTRISVDIKEEYYE